VSLTELEGIDFAELAGRLDSSGRGLQDARDQLAVADGLIPGEDGLATRR
jgi:hypothetical protein